MYFGSVVFPRHVPVFLGFKIGCDLTSLLFSLLVHLVLLHAANCRYAETICTLHSSHDGC